jgi:hypothetical protein
MAITITRALVTTVVTPDEEIRHRVPFFRGELLSVDPDFDADADFDWLVTRDGRVVALPSDAWRPAARG